VRHVGTVDPKAPRLNELPGEPGIQTLVEALLRPF
jgi:hypothetical protein